MPTITRNHGKLGVNLDAADRTTIVTAGCLVLFNARRTSEIGQWRQRCADLDLPELLAEVERLGVELFTGGKKFSLPINLKAQLRRFA